MCDTTRLATPYPDLPRARGFATVTRDAHYTHERVTEMARPMGMVRLPFLNKCAGRESLQRCLDLAGDRSGVGVDGVVRVMTLFFEAIADEMAKGRAVRLPGFGVFVPAPIPERHLRMSRDKTPRCKPVFSASRGLRAQIALGVGPKPENVKALARHRKNHATASGTSARRVFTAMQAFRDQVASQLGEQVRSGEPARAQP